MNTQIQRSQVFLVGLALFLASVFSGCGGSQSQLDKMRATMQASSGNDVEEPTNPNPPSKPVRPASNPPNAASSAPSSNPAVTNDRNDRVAASTDFSKTPKQGTTPQEIADAAKLPPTIDERQPEEALDELARRKRAAENIKRIGQALDAYVKNNNRMPLPGLLAASKVPTLSWRVELLPYLGYQDLYDQFRVEEPWDSPHNSELLKYIPDCYVSPERFDDKTNYLGVAGSVYLFNGDPTYVRKIEDGLGNTLAVLEVNDEYAVPWTAPFDYEPEYGEASKGLGKLRPEGTYAVWANGWPTFIKNEVGDIVLHKAFTYESTDGDVAGTIHNALRVQDLKPMDTSTRPDANNTGLAASTDPRGDIPESTEPKATPKRGVAEPRLPVPVRAAISDATERIRELYESRVRNSQDPKERRTIAEEMATAALEMRSDPAGAFALLSSAMRIYASNHDFDGMVNSVDRQIAMFEVDAVELNIDALLTFARENQGVLADSVDSRQFITRMLPPLHEAIVDDRFDSLDDLVQYAVAYEARGKNREFIADLNRLKTQVTAAANQYRRLSESLADLQSDPENGEANSAVGIYVAFVKGDWSQGLPLLTKGTNERVAQMAKADLATDQDPERMIATADAWWELGESTSNTQLRGACRQRAAHWYQLAFDQLPESLSKLHAKSRLEEAAASEGGSALDTIGRLARDIGMDLVEAKIAMREGVAPRAAAYDDDDD